MNNLFCEELYTSIDSCLRGVDHLYTSGLSTGREPFAITAEALESVHEVFDKLANSAIRSMEGASKNGLVLDETYSQLRRVGSKLEERGIVLIPDYLTERLNGKVSADYVSAVFSQLEREDARFGEDNKLRRLMRSYFGTFDLVILNPNGEREGEDLDPWQDATEHWAPEDKGDPLEETRHFLTNQHFTLT